MNKHRPGPSGGGAAWPPAAPARRGSRASRERARQGCLGFRGLAKLGKLANFANFRRARSRLYQNEFLQENMRLTAFFKLYKICILLHRCNLKNLAKKRFEKSAIFVKFQRKICKCCKICKMLPDFENFSLIIW